jgi:hypothetical protein
MTFGFIICRHVNSEKTNYYWNECIRSIRLFYNNKIIVIDDNSNQDFVKPMTEFVNVEYVTSEFPQRGELLPYYYFHKNKYFDNAIFIHDSVFIKKRINFELLEKTKTTVLPLWHFNESFLPENINNSFRLLQYLKNNYKLYELFINLNKNSEMLGFNRINKWYGCFGVQTFINHHFLSYLQDKYNIFNLLNAIHCRTDRCTLERIMGSIFCLETSSLKRNPSLLGSITNYMKFGYSFDEYINDLNNKNKKLLSLPLIKIWTGR